VNADDTIAAISSAAGAGLRAVVRVSGPGALASAAAVFRPFGEPLARVGGFRWTDGVIAAGGVEMPGRALVFRAPRSYTRQDLVELHIPGSPVAAAMVLDGLLSAGARQAGPGEFTMRAFLSGRLDLSAAGAVADIIDAADDSQLRAAMDAMSGRLPRMAAQAGTELTDALATVEASIDLADEHIELASPRELATALDDLARRLSAAAGESDRAAENRWGPRIVLAGLPNAGKSSLMNALAGSDRAIVSHTPGTTRDVLTAHVKLAGVRAVLQDAAGWAPWPCGGAAAECQGGASPVELLAHQAARAAVAAADVTVLVVDASAASAHLKAAEFAAAIARAGRSGQCVCVLSKCDLLSGAAAKECVRAAAAATGWAAVAASAKTGAGLPELASILGRLAERSESASAAGLRHGQARVVAAAAEAATRAAASLRSAREIADVAELAAIELRAALGELSKLRATAADDLAEDVLARIFSRFCVGK
jgi:tRNA modification GTPase